MTSQYYSDYKKQHKPEHLQLFIVIHMILCPYTYVCTDNTTTNHNSNDNDCDDIEFYNIYMQLCKCL